MLRRMRLFWRQGGRSARSGLHVPCRAFPCLRSSLLPGCRPLCPYVPCRDEDKTVSSSALSETHVGVPQTMTRDWTGYETVLESKGSRYHIIPITGPLILVHSGPTTIGRETIIATAQTREEWILHGKDIQLSQRGNSSLVPA